MKTILDKDIIVIFKDIDNGDENTKVLVMWQKNKNQDIYIYAWTNFFVFSISKVHIKVKAWTDGTIYSTCQEVVIFLYLAIVRIVLP